MKLSIGIVGLPNVGKSTLFKFLTKKEVNIANYPFCTIDPNVGVVEVPDERLAQLANLSKSEKIIPAVVEFYDIAGLVRGANKGEGLGNQFLSYIREVDAILIVLRCFNDSNIVHVEGLVDPLRDLEIINTELILKDLVTVEKRLASLEKEVKSGDKTALQERALMERVKKKLDQGGLLADFCNESAIKNLGLLTAKKQLFILNGTDINITKQLPEGSFVIADLSSGEKSRQALEVLIQKAYQILDLISFFTTGPEETRAWTIMRGSKAPQAAGVIHTDFEKKFIKAEVVSDENLIASGSWLNAKSRGLIRLEGKDYLVKDGDVMVFRHG